MDGQDFYLAIIRHCKELDDSHFRYGAVVPKIWTVC